MRHQIEIALDCDDVIYDWRNPAAQLCEKHGITLAPDGWEFFGSMESTMAFQHALKTERHWYRDLPVFPEAVKAIAVLRDMGVKVLACTSVWAQYLPDRDYALWQQGFGKDDRYYCHGKYRIDVDMLVDDAPHNVRAWSERYPLRHAVLWDRHWNRNTDPEGSESWYRATSWDSILRTAKDMINGARSQR